MNMSSKCLLETIKHEALACSSLYDFGLIVNVHRQGLKITCAISKPVLRQYCSKSKGWMDDAFSWGSQENDSQGIFKDKRVMLSSTLGLLSLCSV